MISSVTSSIPAPHKNLPDELLVRIFRTAGGAAVSTGGSTRNRIGQVCKSWRRLSRTTRSLWSEITIEVFDDEDNWGLPVEPDISIKLVEQCLILSQTHPLDVRIALTAEISESQSATDLIDHAMSRLLANTIRWRTFTCIGPGWIFNYLRVMHAFQSTTLESVTLGCTEGLETLSVILAQPDVTFSSSLRRLDINFPFPQMQPQWSKITSLRMGFTSPSQCHSILSQLTNLISLHLIHIDNSQPAPVNQSPILLHDLRQLKLSACAVNDSILDALRLPNVDQLYLMQPGSSGEGEDHPSHTISQDSFCPTNWNKTSMERISRLLRGSVLPLRVLDVAWAIDIHVLLPIIRDYCQETETFRVELSAQNIRSASFLLDALTSAKDPVLPNLSELGLGFDHCRCDDTLFKGESLERMVRSRWHAVTATKKLRVLYLWGGRDKPPFGSYNLDISEISKVYEVSSLSFTLQQFSEEGLNVKWIYEGYNILNRCRIDARLLQ